MPTQRCGHVRFLLKTGKARVVRRSPFTIRLTYKAQNYVQPITLGVDVGSRHIGLSATTKTKELYAAQCEIRDDVSKYIRMRRCFRQSRRSRKCRYRKRRFLNRKRREKWSSPSIRTKINSYLRIIKLIVSIMPVQKIRMEIARFDTAKILNPNIYGKGYTEGVLKGFHHINEYVLLRDKFSCQNCYGRSNDKRMEVHHIIRRVDLGTNKIDNLITLCHTCHEGFHNGNVKLFLSSPKPYRMRDSSMMNVLCAALPKQINKEVCEKGIIVESTYGVETKHIREKQNITKSHINDAFCISGNVYAERARDIFYHKCLRRHNRMLHKQTIHSPKAYRGRRNLTILEQKIGFRSLYQVQREIKGIRLYDEVLYNGKWGYVSSRSNRGRFKVRDSKGILIADNVGRNKIILLAHSSGILTSREAKEN